MNGTLATEPTEKPAARSLQETWGKNERMRHVPTAEWVIDKLDNDLRRRIDILASVPSSDAIDAELKALCRAIERLADTAKHSRPQTQPPPEIAGRIDSTITHAVSCLRSLDPSLFGRRYPFQTFERSKAEAVYGGLLVVVDRVHRLTAIARSVDRSIDERLLERAAD